MISLGVKEENIIRLELDKRKSFVFRNPITLCDMVEQTLAGKNVQKEIDFVVNDMDRRIYIQSAYIMSKEDKVASELDSLRKLVRELQDENKKLAEVLCTSKG